MNDLVSIVVPVYNVQPYLDRCLKSLTEQTYRNIEIILVDDGSRDGSGELCDRWSETDPRVRVFHKENGGLSDARNYGFSRTSGAYVCFVDSDDWCDHRYVEVMLKTLLQTDSDIAECDCMSTHRDDSVPSSETDYACEVFAGRECFLRFLTNVFSVGACNKMFRKQLLEGEPFKLGVYHEDEFWNYKIMSKARRACRLHYTGYYYYQRQGSITHTRLTCKRLSDRFEAGRERVEFIERHYPEFASVGYSKMMYSCMYLYNEARCSVFEGSDVVQGELVSYHRGMLRGYLKKRQYQKELWRFFLFALLPDCYCRMYARNECLDTAHPKEKRIYGRARARLCGKSR